jgi:hypothetical protein
MIHPLGSIEEVAFLNRSVEAFFDECQKVRDVSWP